VVGCVLEAWLASKFFAVGSSASASGIPRETREDSSGGSSGSGSVIESKHRSLFSFSHVDGDTGHGDRG
ncbi:hypothetical protein DFH11DRAFT_1676505, partial [Phellopilus nigrolimitatus]